MRGILTLAGFLAASATLAGCNPPAKQISVPCNCNGTTTPANPSAENQRFVPPPATEEEAQYPAAHHRYSHRHHGYGRGYHHGYDGSDDSYARYWSTARVAMNSYDYRSTSRVIYDDGSRYGAARSEAYRSESYADGRDDSDRGWQDGYGRIHRGTHLSRGEFYARMDPWHGYGADCDDRHHRHYRHRY